MHPAFPSTGSAARFGGILLFFLTLPVVLYWCGGVSKEEVYRGISERAGPFAESARQFRYPIVIGNTVVVGERDDLACAVAPAAIASAGSPGILLADQLVGKPTMTQCRFGDAHTPV